MVVGGGSTTAPKTKSQLAAAKKAGAVQSAAAEKKKADELLALPATDDKKDGRPDKAAYDKEQNAIKAEIEVLQAKANAVKEKIAAATGKGPNHERRTALRAELDGLRGEQAKVKGSRDKKMAEIRSLQDAMNKKVKDLQASKGKSAVKSVADADAQIKALEKRVESGTLSLVDERKTLTEISALRKQRKSVEAFGSSQTSIDADKKKLDELRAALDDPEAKAINEKWSKVKEELDAIGKAQDESRESRDALFEERNKVSKELDVAYGKKKASAGAYKEANDKFYTKLNEERARRTERQKAERLEYEEKKRSEINTRLLEEAQAPAFERQIEDCSTLVLFFQNRLGGGSAPAPAATSTGRLGAPSSANLPKHELRQVDSGVPEGAVAIPKKGSQEQEFFMGGGGGKKGKKGGKKPLADGETAAPTPTQPLNLPFGTLSALLELDVKAPITIADLLATIEAVEAKKKYYVENQARVTAENIAAVEKKIAAGDAKAAKATNGHAEKEKPAEPEAAAAAVEPAAEEAKATEEA